MKKRVLVIAVILCIFMAGQASSLGLGVQANFYTGEDMFLPGFSLLVSPTEKFHIAANWLIGKENDTSIIGLTADAIVFDPLFFRIGVGGYANIFLNDGFEHIRGGVRFPLGISLPIGKLEIFAHVAPSIGVNFDESLDFLDWFFPVAIGARWWF